mmetsp:Transcript_75971/g.232526  ORF Transcript_75971/g.232526 Transcript_75971/m.232526 type:complete len:553 (-) Transcript_75971:769-2427(-)
MQYAGSDPLVEVGDAGKGGVELLVLDVHLRHRVQVGDAGSLEAFVVLNGPQRFQQRPLDLVAPRVAVGHVRADLADPADETQGHRQDAALGLGARGRPRPLLLGGAGLAGQEDVEDPLRLGGLVALGLLPGLLRKPPPRGGDEDAPPPIDVAVPHVHQPARVEEGRDVLRPHDDLPQLLLVAGPLLRQVIMIGDGLVEAELVLGVVFDDGPQVLDLGQLDLQVAFLVLDGQSVAVLLELVEAPLDHVVRVGPLEAQQVDEHVVPQMEGAGYFRGRTQEHGLRCLGFNLLVEHDDRQAAVVLAAPSGAPGHLDVLAGEQHAVLQTVPLPRVREDHRLGGHVDAHGERLGRKQDFDQRLLEKNLYDLLEHREEASVVDAEAAAQQRQHALHLRKLAVLVAQRHDRVVEHLVDELLLLIVRDVQLLQRDRVGLALLSAEGENDHGQVAAVVAHTHDLLQVRHVGLAPPLQLLLRLDAGGLRGLLQNGHSAVEIILFELPLLIDDHVYAIATIGEQVVLQGHRSFLRVDHMARLVLDPANPLRELPGVRDRGRQEN